MSIRIVDRAAAGSPPSTATRSRTDHKEARTHTAARHMTDGQTIYERNRSVYNSADVAEIYAGTFLDMGLLKAEAAIVSRLGDRIAGRAILDVGVGGGRTVKPLRAVASRYVGIDYAEEMIRRCRHEFPDVEFRHCDAIDLSEFEGDSFDVVWFSFNGIDYALPDDRVQIITQIRRVVKPGGSFVFSSHNIRARPWRPKFLPAFEFDWNPWQLACSTALSIAQHFASIYYYRRNKPHEIRGDGFEVRVDQAHEYRLLTYHVAASAQVAQLEVLGFEEIEAVGLDGSVLAQGDDADDAWIYYVARKRAPLADPG
jgi:ubiquinone/menaquinone biosynthesis C-methylase UbiE